MLRPEMHGSVLGPGHAPRRTSSLPRTTELEWREPLRDYRGVEYAILIPSAFGYHPVPIFNLAGIDVVDFFAAVLLADPFRRTVVLDGLLVARTHANNVHCSRIL